MTLIMVLYIRTQLIVFHTRINLLCGSLQKLSPFETDPDANHGEIAFACTLKNRAAAALGAELAEDWKSAVGSLDRGQTNRRTGGIIV